MSKRDKFKQIEVKSRAEWHKWLMQNHAQSKSVWLVTYKKPDPRYVPYDEVVEESLCFGWVDSQPRIVDEQRSMRLHSPRNVKSAWSRINKERVEKLIASGSMQPAGMALVEAAMKNGTWSKLNDVEDLKLPDDLRNALSKNKTAVRFFETFPRSVKRAILEWIMLAKKPETRAARIADTVEKAKSNIRANQWRQ